MIDKLQHIINKLDQVDFHDLPVKGFYIEKDLKFLLRIDYFDYVESKKDYDDYSIVFTEIETLKLQGFEFTEANELEITNFDYKIAKGLIMCKIIFLTGFSKPSFDLEVDCRNIEIIKNNQNL